MLITPQGVVGFLVGKCSYQHYSRSSIHVPGGNGCFFFDACERALSGSTEGSRTVDRCTDVTAVMSLLMYVTLLTSHGLFAGQFVLVGSGQHGRRGRHGGWRGHLLTLSGCRL